MIYKIKIKDRETGEENFVIMGDSYKPFKDHFIDIISHWTKNWHYESEEQYAKCFGRTLKFDLMTLYVAKGKFVSYGGLKMSYEDNYNKEVDEHNKYSKEHKTYSLCPHLENLSWREDKDLLKSLIKQSRVISEEELERLKVTPKPSA